MGKTLISNRVVIFGGNLSEINPEICNEINSTDFIICADAGYKFAESNNIHPDLIVGDFDSAPIPENQDCEIIKLPTHKNDTDLHFAINLALKRGCNRFILTGFTGGRLDHTLATITSLNFLADKAENCYVWDLKSKIFIVNSSISIVKPDFDCYFSVFPITENADGVCIKGAEYPLDNATLVNTFPLGVSNEFKDNNVEISLKSGKLLVAIIKKS